MESVSGGVEDLEIEVEDGDSSDDETGIVGYFFSGALCRTLPLHRSSVCPSVRSFYLQYCPLGI